MCATCLQLSVALRKTLSETNVLYFKKEEEKNYKCKRGRENPKSL